MPYVELHCHSAFSFLDGASHPIELAAAAAEQGHAALALTDHDGLHGAMELAQAAEPLGVRAIVGAELTLAHAGTRPAPGREPLAPTTPLKAVEHHAEGLVCLSGCAREGALAARVERG